MTVEDWESRPSREQMWYSPKTVAEIRRRLDANRHVARYPHDGRAYYWRDDEIEMLLKAVAGDTHG